jgi:hypothetical protein
MRVVNEIDIKIYDENNNLVNFNNLDWNLTIVITTEIKYDQPEISLNNTLNKNMLNLQQPIEDYNDRRIEEIEKQQIEKQQPENIDPIKLQNEKELDILNY